ncbi:phospho-acceptor domain-containing protein [Arcticibacter pallidicorallinus]|uniref:histidine kinase n=1 Tax=Arcticibacter pallidicorallinus TaxID=1259464 RepID=A0A2T0UBN8_9SPHI|nr:sensor histidine kinase [Arcticibacter pallidicorallinus]PRY55304.1 phospho-acceptor domain-containing protein [Arcticibacter pallidicorallinus]
MITLVTISLENEMDLVLAHKKSIAVAGKLGLTIATQTTFGTAVSEISRTVIEHTDTGILRISLEVNGGRYSLKATITCDSGVGFNSYDTGFYYAQKLVPEFSLTEQPNNKLILIRMGLPRSLKLDPLKTAMLVKYFQESEPLNAYEEIKVRNTTLNRITEEQEEELRRSKIIDEKKTEFISIASHEIKTPITIIKAYTQIAKSMSSKENTELQTILAKVDFQTSKLLSLVQQLLDVSKLENGSLQYTPEIVEINAFISDAVQVIQHILPDNKVSVETCEDSWVSVDRLRLDQVISNILTNAAKYSPGGSLIEIKCVRRVDDFLQVSVRDRGIGMSEETIKSVFDKFYRDKDVLHSHSGLGMGLYVASKIVASHGGRIWVESVEGTGSVFHFTLPCVSGDPE